ncbi:DUF192 domain-containing protein [Pontivivens insulae]|uniref:DUF192 domain-containing protein n=1 Tax=Pontivivens insulae TaxID=1639689 RepID=A0A2R8AC70_9RHOB|nr:DUF192 domain-containing protein [Pontivivens insulae]RED11033.1 hypothetical protein DFR53_3061 [Pontivivens insulae]SPF29792.1 hypothetical protein POI8812_02110 [Pontivivens insulae]
MIKTFVAALAVSLIGPVAALAQSCSVDRVDIRQNGVVASFAVEIADDFEERSRGLMFVESIPQFSGMLFLYQDGPRRRSFWMRNTLIPLDMLFISETGEVRDIHENAVPLDETPIPSETDDIVAVLEINGGLSAMLRFEPGAEIRHPAFNGPDAVWACD